MDGSRDPFLDQFYSRVPASVAATFTDAQLDAIKRAYGARTRGAHGVEVRKSFPFLWMRLYVVLLMGRERRGFDRLAHEGGMLGTAADAIMLCLTWFLFLLPWLGVLYVFKSSIGIDLSNDGGVHSFWHDMMQQLTYLFS